MSDGKALFHTDHDNLVESGGGAPDEATLSAGRIGLDEADPARFNRTAWLVARDLAGARRTANRVEKLVAAINPASIVGRERVHRQIAGRRRAAPAG